MEPAAPPEMPVDKPQWRGRGPTAVVVACEPFPAVDSFGSSHSQVDWGLGEASVYFLTYVVQYLLSASVKKKTLIDNYSFKSFVLLCFERVLKPCFSDYRSTASFS